MSNMLLSECKKHRKKNIKVLMKNWLSMFIWQEMWILHAKCLIKHFGGFNQDLGFMPNLIQIIIDIVTLCWKPNIHMELCNTSL